jgi:malate dehydrogenase (oxaloacetate-decarboxylating)(NADP+)
MSNRTLHEDALRYHRLAPAGKLAVQATKPLATQHDLALAYSPGVAAACEAIQADPLEAAALTSRGNLVAVVTNGTAVLGLGAIGPLAAKPVMEGKAVLFKKFAGIDAFDLEISERDPERFVDILASLEPSFGAINLEDIKAPECFQIEGALRERMHIPVFHDDQHGTAIIVGAAVLNGLRVVGKNIDSVRLVSSGAGAAALACLDLLVKMGLRREHITVTDVAGVVYQGRVAEMDPYKARYAQATNARTLADVIGGADIFLGLSVAGVLTSAMVERMADKPLILALANPVPEIMPEEAKAARKDAVIASGRSDYPNQVNNVLCFPFLFRGVLDVGATAITTQMELACAHAIADLASAEVSDVVSAAYGDQSLIFGADYILPKPFDPRLITTIPPAVARAAMESGVATRPIENFDTYRESLSRLVYRSGDVMKHVFARAKENQKRVIYSEGEDPRVLRAMQTLIENQWAQPVAVGRREVVTQRIKELGLRIKPESDFELIDPQHLANEAELADDYHDIMWRHGVLPDAARNIVRTTPTVLSALMLRAGAVDAMMAGPVGTFHGHLQHVLDVIGLAQGVRAAAAMQLLILDKGTYFIVDTYVNQDPDAELITEITLLAAEQVRRLGITPKVALVSHSNFGSFDSPSAVKLRHALALLQRRVPELEVDGEMQTDAALLEDVRRRLYPKSRLAGEANLLVMPNMDAANIAFNALKVLANGVSVGPMLLGTAKPVHILNRSVTTRGTLNMGVLAAVDAQAYERLTELTAY